MGRMTLMLTPALAVGMAVGAIGSQALMAQPTPVTRTILQQKDLEGLREERSSCTARTSFPAVLWGDIFTLAPS
jgi:hypothetical protein